MILRLFVYNSNLTALNTNKLDSNGYRVTAGSWNQMMYKTPLIALSNSDSTQDAAIPLLQVTTSDGISGVLCYHAKYQKLAFITNNAKFYIDTTPF